jgi:hypothetical protein
MRDSSMKENVSQELPQKTPPDQNRNQAEVDLEPPGDQHLKEKNRSHDDHQILDDWCQTISK